MKVHLVDGTYELFRYFYAMPSATSLDGHEVGAIRGVLGSMVGLLEGGATHVGVATDHVIESFRNDLWPGYKTGEGVDSALLAQFHPLEDAFVALGVVTWPMVEFEADDALGAAALRASADPGVSQVIVCTPDKDLAQVVDDDRIVQLDRRSGKVRNEAGVRERFGVGPASIPDYLALVGDSADGYPGIRGWGEKSAGAVLGCYGHLEAIPEQARTWDVNVRRADALNAALREGWENALLFRQLATLRVDTPTFEKVEDLRWTGPHPSFFQLCARMDAQQIFNRAMRAAENR